jgi:hypothetical protein
MNSDYIIFKKVENNYIKEYDIREFFKFAGYMSVEAQFMSEDLMNKKEVKLDLEDLKCDFDDFMNKINSYKIKYTIKINCKEKR